MRPITIRAMTATYESVIQGLYATMATSAQSFNAPDGEDGRMYRWDIYRIEGRTIYYTRQYQPCRMRSCDL